MINENWEGRDLAGFIKTTLAQQVQKSLVGEFSNSFGASSLLSTVSKKTSDENKAKIADGIDMGNQVPKGIIPIIYGHIGMSNTQFDNGQAPSSVDAEIVVQSIKMPISEGPIVGTALLESDDVMTVQTPANSVNHLKNVIINDSYVIDPTTNVANFKDVKFEMTYGDGTLNKQESTLLETNPLLDVDIEAVDDTINDKALNDLSDVNAGKGVNYVLYWNTTEGKWEAKSFNTLLNEAGATYNGGAGGDGGAGGTGGDGGTGGEGGVGPSDGSGLKYTQWNPPPHHIEAPVNSKTEITYTAPPTTPASVVTGKGAPLRESTESTPYFQSTVSFDIDDNIDTLKAKINFPDGIYLEKTTVTTVIDNGSITLCDSQRPDLEGADSGDLECLTPSVTVADDGQSATVKERETASVIVYYAFTTTLCGREFILHEGSETITHKKNGRHTHTISVPLASMNAGAGTKADGTQQDGSLIGFGDCNSTDVNYYKFDDWTLSDYLTAYPDQIINSASAVKVYAWVSEKVSSADYTISTNTYLQELSVCSDLNNYDGLYSLATTNVNPFNQFQPDHGFNYEPHETETEVEAYSLLQKRCEEEIVSGAFSTVKNPDPLLVWDYTSMGEPGEIGDGGTAGTAGASGSAGTSGTVAVPNLEPIPSVDSKDSSYPGDGTASTITLGAISVFNDDPAATNLLTIAVSSGTCDVVTTPAGVTVQDANTSSLKIQGAIADIQTCLDAGIEYTSTTATLGDVTETLTISTSAGQSVETSTIRSQAITDFSGPTFTITVTNYVGTFDAYVRGKAIMNSITGATSNDATATAIASAIQSYTSYPNWTATASGNVVTCVGEAGLGSSYNGVQPTYTGTMSATMSEISGGVSPSRKTQPVRNTGNLKAKFIPALAFTNTLNDTAVSYAQVAYRPPQGDGQTTLSEVGFMVGGRLIENALGSSLSFSAWQSANYTSTPSWTNNPAWVFLDYLRNSTYGLGLEIFDTLDANQKSGLMADVYNFALWCQQHQGGDDIADCNAIIYGAESKIEVLQKIAATGNAKFVYLNGNPRLIFDGYAFSGWGGHTPIPKKLVNQTNAGNLLYQSGSIDNLYNVVNVKFANSDNFYRLEEVQYRNTSSIATFGERETTIDAWGVTDKQQALWQGAWTYETEAVNSEMVTYIAGWDHFDILPGDLICLNDTLRVDNTLKGGRVISIGSGTVTLDRDAGSGNIAIIDTSGVVQYGTVSGTTATISGTFQANAVWNVYTGAVAQNYRVVAIEESEDGIFAVTAQKHDPDKYTRIWANTI